MDEFDWIDLLKPLASSAEARGLRDDAAIVPSRPEFDLVISKDAIVEGVHFLPDDPLDLVARKLLRVNLSDIAAKGAEAWGYLLAIAWPGARSDADRRAFVDGLRTDQASYGLTLLGGDTVSTPGPLVASVTMLGWVEAGRAVGRAGARVGDGLWVTGPIGEGWLGLKAARGEIASDRLAVRYRLPKPRIDLAVVIRRLATASADVSDGLLADASRIADASGVRARVDLDTVPLSPEGLAWGDRLALATGGDDYEVVFTAPPGAAPDWATRIGEIVEGHGLTVLADGRPVSTSSLGWRHR